jgi:hypothetical protein
MSGKIIGFETGCEFKVWLDYRLCEGNEALKLISVRAFSDLEKVKQPKIC